MAYVNRDPFARQETHKRSESGECGYCGSSNRYGKVWRYRTETDGGRVFEDSRVFCSLSCRNAYHS